MKPKRAFQLVGGGLLAIFGLAIATSNAAIHSSSFIGLGLAFLLCACAGLCFAMGLAGINDDEFADKKDRRP